MSEFKQLVEQLSPSGVSADFVEIESAWAEEHARAIGLTARFVLSRTLLHLPLHSEEEITSSPDEVVEVIEPKVAALGASFKVAYDGLKAKSEMG